MPSAGPKSSNVNLKIDASRRNVPWQPMLPLKRLDRWWVGWEGLFGCFFFVGGRGVVYSGENGADVYWWNCDEKQTDYEKSFSRNWSSGSGWNTVQVGWWFLVQVCWAQLFKSPIQGLEEKVATKCRFLADRKGEDSQKLLGLSRWRVKLLKVRWASEKSRRRLFHESLQHLLAGFFASPIVGRLSTIYPEHIHLW